MSVGLHVRNLNVAKDAVDDLVLLHPEDITEEGIVRDLENRYNNDEIYTYIGPVLISVNPFRNLPGYYTSKMMQEYYGKYKYELAPHVFASAEEAHRNLMASGINQCVLISGESGAGKTEAAKKVMEYVSRISSENFMMDEKEVKRQSKRLSKLRVNHSLDEIKDSLLKSNPVLESFGNAKTLRNDNSSRFGKYMEIQMDYNGIPLGGKITNYLLEKPRVVHQVPGERGFHIFYMLCDGMPSSDPLYSKLGLAPSSNFNYLQQDKDAEDFSDMYEEVIDAMPKVGITEAIKEQLFTIVAAILHIGNIQFKAKEKKCVVDSGSKDSLNMASQLLQVKPKDLEFALTTRSRETTIDKVASPLLKVDECEKVRDALSRATYTRLFQALVKEINTMIFTDKSELSLGVLDIYGFEIFEYNSFEQLCINYCNEKLQQYFIQLTLKAEQDEYVREGIEWKDIEYFNNQIVCDLVEGKRPPGIIAYMDEQITLGRGNTADNDKTLLAKLDNQLEGHPHYEPTPAGTPTFVIKHYAGDVEYNVANMVDKNKDTLYRDLLVLAGEKSKSGYLNEMFPEGREKHNFKKPITAGTQFVADMKELIANLEKCEPHYIRTIKPNDKKRSSFYNSERVLHQVKYLGLLENVRVRRAGYAYRREYNLFVRRYKMISPETWPTSSSDPKADTKLLLEAVGVDPAEAKYGKTKIFLENATSLFQLESKRAEKMNMVVGVIQHAYRQWKLRLYYQKLREVSVKLLHGQKRRNNSWILYFLGDYVNGMKNPEVMQAIRMNTVEDDDERLLFCDVVTSHELDLTVKRAKDELKDRTLVITNRGIYLLKDKVQDMIVIRFDKVESVCLSQFADNFIVFNQVSKPNPKEGKPDLLQDSILIESVRKSEICTVLNEEFGKLGKDSPLTFQNETTMVTRVKRGGVFARLNAKLRKNVKATKGPAVKKTVIWKESGSNDKFAKFKAPVMSIHAEEAKEGEPVDPDTAYIFVGDVLASGAQIQLNDELPERVLAHTAFGRQGKKRRRNKRRGY
eukprot:maker-scaffold_3-snap-gene-15.26-mRNA-1 protein AED:0.07 eAED:0.07 QI:107/0.5/0.33/1/1/1/3/0/1026